MMSGTGSAAGFSRNRCSRHHSYRSGLWAGILKTFVIVSPCSLLTVPHEIYSIASHTPKLDADNPYVIEIEGIPIRRINPAQCRAPRACSGARVRDFRREGTGVWGQGLWGVNIYRYRVPLSLPGMLLVATMVTNSYTSRQYVNL